MVSFSPLKKHLRFHRKEIKAHDATCNTSEFYTCSFTGCLLLSVEFLHIVDNQLDVTWISFELCRQYEAFQFKYTLDTCRCLEWG